MPALEQTISDLIKQLPATDKEQQPAATKPGENQPEAKAASEAPASKFTGPSPDDAAKVLEKVLEFGRDGLVELIRQTRSPEDPKFDNYKASYLLHGIVVAAGKPGQEQRRRLVADTLAAEVSNDLLPAPTRALLIRELQWIGDTISIAALGKALAHEQLCDEAASALVSIGDSAAAELRAAYPSSKGSCQRTLVQSLAQLRDREAKDIWRQALGSDDQETRLISSWALARTGDEASSTALLALAEKETGSARAQATHTCLLLAEQLLAAGNKSAAQKIYTHLREKRTGADEAYLREIASKALASPGQL